MPLLGHIHLQGCLSGVAFAFASTSSTEAVQLLKVPPMPCLGPDVAPVLCPRRAMIDNCRGLLLIQSGVQDE